jgi:hypothetical protein
MPSWLNDLVRISSIRKGSILYAPYFLASEKKEFASFIKNLAHVAVSICFVYNFKCIGF